MEGFELSDEITQLASDILEFLASFSHENFFYPSEFQLIKRWSKMKRTQQYYQDKGDGTGLECIKEEVKSIRAALNECKRFRN